MIRAQITVLFFLFSVMSTQLFAQDLMDMLKDETPKTNYTYATFKTTRLVLGQSVESPASGTLQFLIEHNFGAINSGAYNMWGLDVATIRLGLEYGINDWLSVGVGRSSYEKNIRWLGKSQNPEAKYRGQKHAGINVVLWCSHAQFDEMG